MTAHTPKDHSCVRARLRSAVLCQTIELITAATIRAGATTSSTVEKSNDPRHFEWWHCCCESMYQEQVTRSRRSSAPQTTTPRHDTGIAESATQWAKLPRGDRDLEINMWQFAPDRRMVILHSPRPGALGAGDANWPYISARDCNLERQRDRFRRDIGDVFACAAEYDVARINTLSGQSA